jgi:acyl-coenzyme A thioesterase PaaI-like protein
MVILSVVPDSATFLTAGLAIDLHGPMRPGELAVTADVIRLTGRDATVEVTIAQHDRIVSLATIRHVIRR